MPQSLQASGDVMSPYACAASCHCTLMDAVGLLGGIVIIASPEVLLQKWGNVESSTRFDITM
jgi:hypothetical protein